MWDQNLRSEPVQRSRCSLVTCAGASSRVGTLHEAQIGKVVIASRSGDAYPREVQMLTHVAFIEVCAMRPHVIP